MKQFQFKNLILVCFAVFVLSHSASAATVKVGYLEGYGVVDNLNSVDQKGYGYDILKASEQYSDLEFEFIPVTDATVFSSLATGIIDIFGPVTQTASLSSQWSFSRSFGSQQITLTAPSGSTLLFDDYSNFTGKTVTVLEDLGFTSYLTSYASSNAINFNQNKVLDFDSFYGASDDLRLGSSLLDNSNRKVVATLGLEQMYFISSNVSTLAALNNALNNLEINSPLFMSDAYRQYYNSTTNSTSLNPTQAELLQIKSSFTVGYLSNHFPVEGIDDSGHAVGIAVDIINLVAAQAGIQLVFKPYSLTDSVDLSQFDINIAWAGQDNFHDFYNATNAFSSSTPLMLIANDGISDPYSTVSSIGILPFTCFDVDNLKKTYPNSSFTFYNSYKELATALKDGAVNGVIVSNICSDYVLSLLGDTGYGLYGTTHSFPVRFFVNKNLGTEYLHIFNTLISKVDGTEIEKAFLSQISTYRAEPTLLDLILNYWYIYVLGAVLVTCGFFAFYLILQRKKQQAVLDALNYDEITGLDSEIKFLSDVEQILKTAENDRYMIVTFDIDHFSLIRKQYGYDLSNDVLKKVGESLKKSFSPDALVCRSKADLFVVFDKQYLPGKAVCDEMVIEDAQNLLASTHPLSASQGCYRINDTTMPVQLMIDYCNMARLQGKSVYGLTLNEYTKELDEKRELNNSIVLRMERALLGKELIPYYQPKVHLKSSEITGCEALVRWCDIDSDLDIPRVKYMPDEFIPLFEENGFIAKLDYHIFDEICSLIRRNLKVVDIPKISINLSGVTLLKHDLRNQLVNTLERYRLSPREIDLEITESAFTQYPKESASKVRVLRNEGFTISMDDFGTGASSLNRLKDMDITTIKLDKAFLDYNLAELKGSVIIGNMINMARRLGLEVVAEGVETKEQLSALKMLHCDLVQGYYYAKPVNEADFMEMLKEPVCLPSTEREKLKAQAAAAAAKAAEAELGAIIP